MTASNNISFRFKGYFWSAYATEPGPDGRIRLHLKCDQYDEDSGAGWNFAVDAFYSAASKLHLTEIRDISHSGSAVSGTAVPGVLVEPDDDHDSDAFKQSFRETFPTIAKVLSWTDSVMVTHDQWDEIQKLPGFFGGPDYSIPALKIVDAD